MTETKLTEEGGFYRPGEMVSLLTANGWRSGEVLDTWFEGGSDTEQLVVQVNLKQKHPLVFCLPADHPTLRPEGVGHHRTMVQFFARLDKTPLRVTAAIEGVKPENRQARILAVDAVISELGGLTQDNVAELEHQALRAWEGV